MSESSGLLVLRFTLEYNGLSSTDLLMSLPACEWLHLSISEHYSYTINWLIPSHLIHTFILPTVSMCARTHISDCWEWQYCLQCTLQDSLTTGQVGATVQDRTTRVQARLTSPAAEVSRSSPLHPSFSYLSNWWDLPARWLHDITWLDCS